ncbi:MAG: ABC transporter permease [Bacteroidota bacterium]
MNTPHPPKWAERFLEWFCREDLYDAIRGDLEELYTRNHHNHGPRKAAWLFVWHVVLFFQPFAFKKRSSLTSGKPFIMFTYHFKIAWRHLLTQSGYSVINIVGLTAGMTMAMLVVLWIQEERSYDQFHDNIDRIYRVMRHFSFGDEISTGISVAYPVYSTLRDQYPEIEKLVLTSHEQTLVFQHGDVLSKEHGFFAGPAFFEIFSFNLRDGTKSEVLKDPSSVVVSTSLAEKYFGTEWSTMDIIGQTIRIGEKENYHITGVFEEVPHNSTLQFDYVLSIGNYLQNRNITNWNNSNLKLYVLLREEENIAGLNRAIKNIQNEHIQGFTSDLFLHPYQDMHLQSNFENGVSVTSRIEYYIRIFGVVAFLIVGISSANFTNLSIARSMRRAKEISVRKIVGASRNTLAFQFLWEAILVISISFILSVVLLPLVLPVFNSLIDKEIRFSHLSPVIILVFAGIGIATALLAGAYPALYLSSIKTMEGLKSFFRIDKWTVFSRKVLIVFQFVISILLIVGSITVYRQLDFIQSKNLGIDKEHVLYFPLEGELRPNYGAFKNELLANSHIKEVTSSSQNPLDISNTTHTFSWSGIDRSPDDKLHVMTVNYDFLDVMDIQLHMGRDFEEDLGTDIRNYLINERLLTYGGFKNPLGKKITLWGSSEGEVVGVVKDFHMSDFYSEIEPTIIRLQPEETKWLFIRTEKNTIKEALVHIEAIYEEFNPTYPFTYQFLDENFQVTYRSEQIMGRLAFCFTIFALLISSLGLLGLVILSSEQRLKEIGVRKILGASISGIMMLLSREIVILLGISLLIALPVSFLLVQDWLDHFSYRISMEAFVFATAGGLSIFLVLISISWYTFRVATLNPINSLRAE